MPWTLPWTAEPAYPDPDPRLRDAARRWREAVDPAELRRLVEALPGPRNRLDSPEAMARTDELILDSWRAAGWEVERQELHLRDVRAWRHRYPRLDGANLLGVLPGTDPAVAGEAIVVVAHHDTVAGSPGADDNGSGLAALLTLARLLGGRQPRRTLVLAAPDFEELGLIGSRWLVRELRDRYRVRSAIVYDPIGYMDRTPGSQLVPPGIGLLYPGQIARLRERALAGDSVVTLYQGRSRRLARSWARCLAATIGGDRVVLLRDPGDLPLVGRLSLAVPLLRNFARSDHLNFWRARLPAIQVTDTANFRNPHYHGAGDLPAILDYETLAGIVAASALLVERLDAAR